MVEQAIQIVTQSVTGFGTGIASGLVSAFDTVAMNGEQLSNLGSFGFMFIGLGIITGIIGWAAHKVG